METESSVSTLICEKKIYVEKMNPLRDPTAEEMLEYTTRAVKSNKKIKEYIQSSFELIEGQIKKLELSISVTNVGTFEELIYVTEETLERLAQKIDEDEDEKEIHILYLAYKSFYKAYELNLRYYHTHKYYLDYRRSILEANNLRKELDSYIRNNKENLADERRRSFVAKLQMDIKAKECFLSIPIRNFMLDNFIPCIASQTVFEYYYNYEKSINNIYGKFYHIGNRYRFHDRMIKEMHEA